MPAGMIELAERLGTPAIYFLLSMMMLVWGARSYVNLRTNISRDYRESVQDTLNIIKQLQSSSSQQTTDLELVKNELLRRIGAVDRRITSRNSWINLFLAPEPMLMLSAAATLIMLITNALVYRFDYFSSYRSHVGLFLSFVVGLAVLKSPRPWYIRVPYYVLISTFIFVTAFGVANLLATSGL
jgi:hypothetical protein